MSILFSLLLSHNDGMKIIVMMTLFDVQSSAREVFLELAGFNLKKNTLCYSRVTKPFGHSFVCISCVGEAFAANRTNGAF